MNRRRIVVGITGATGSAIGVRILQMLRDIGGWETHLVVSRAGYLNAAHELQIGSAEIKACADVVHPVTDIGATIASGSFLTEGMIVAPCSMKTLASVAHGFSDNLISRAADVILKERRQLVLVTRETPLNLAHLRNMVAVTEMGGIIFPPVPSFYNAPRTVDEIVDHLAARVLDLFGVSAPQARRWPGLRGLPAEEDGGKRG